MLFNCGPAIFESEKERNFYFKVFAGYLFNEHVPGIELRVRRFCQLVSDTPHRGKAADRRRVSVDPRTAHVSFDNHAYLFGEASEDKGEFADVLIHDLSTRTIIAIEAKVHSDWNYAKDVESNDARLKCVEARLTDVRIVPCLLVTTAKWNRVRKLDNHGGSNHRRFNDRVDNRCRVLLWEDVIAVCDSPDVTSWAEGVLARPRSEAEYGFKDGWFVRP